MTTLLQLDVFFKDLVCFRDRLRKKNIGQFLIKGKKSIAKVAWIKYPL